MEIKQENNAFAAECMAAYCRFWPDEHAALAPLAQQFADRPETLFCRKTMPGHITASGIVLCRGKLLMVFHPFLKLWLQPGGHIEEGETPLSAAIREVWEETGMETYIHPWHRAAPIPFDIDIHSIAANPKKDEPCHFHYDFRYLLVARETEIPQTSELDCAWQNLANIREAGLQRLICKIAFGKLV